MIIGISGFIGSGKDTIADYLVNVHGFRRESFAGTLKDIVSVVFGWDRAMLEGRTKESREWREQPDPWWAERLTCPHLTPRWVLQYWGTEVCRKNFHDDIWVASLENKLRNSKDDIVISDVRFPNEVKALRSQKATTIWVKRGELPSWYEDAVATNRGLSRVMLEQRMIHPSEWAWIGTDFDQVIENDSSYDDLYFKVKNLVSSLQVSKAT